MLGGCLAVGTAAGLDPVLGVAAALGIAFILVVLADLHWGLLAFVVVSFIDVVRFQGSSLTFTKLAGLALCGSWLATIATEDRRTGRDFFAHHAGYVSLLAVFLALVTISAFWAEDVGATATALQRYGLNMLLLPIVYTAVRERRHVTGILVAFVIGALLSTAYGLVFPVQPITGDASRLAGALGESNETAAMLVAAIALCAGLIGAARRSPALVGAGIVATMLAIGGLVHTLSRSGMLSLGVSLVAASILGGRWRKPLVMVTLVGVVGSLAYVLAFAPSAARDRLISTDSTGRSDLWEVAWRAAEDHPLRGLGAGNFPVSSVHYLVQPGATTRADFIVTTPKVVHNMYLEQLAELGIVGLTLFLAIPAAALRCMFLAAKRFGQIDDPVLEMMSRAVMVALVGVLAADLFASEQYSKQLWILMSLGPALQGLSERRMAA